MDPLPILVARMVVSALPQPADVHRHPNQHTTVTSAQRDAIPNVAPCAFPHFWPVPTWDSVGRHVFSSAAFNSRGGGSPNPVACYICP